MSRPKETGAYPQVFLDIADALTQDKTRKFELKFATRGAAMSLRLDFYTFKNAAIREGLADKEHWPEIKAFYMDVPPKEEWAGVATIMHRDYSPMATKLQEAYDQTINGEVQK